MRRLLAGAALIGFVAGAFSTALLVWRFGNFVGQMAAALNHNHRPAALDGLETMVTSTLITDPGEAARLAREIVETARGGS